MGILNNSNRYSSEAIANAKSLHPYNLVINHRSALPGYLGKGITSLMFSSPVAKRIILSKPKPKPLCLTVPKRRRSRYHSYGSRGSPISNILKCMKNFSINTAVITSSIHNLKTVRTKYKPIVSQGNFKQKI